MNLGAGALNDASGAGPDNPGAYRAMLMLFFVLSLFGLRSRGAASAREEQPGSRSGDDSRDQLAPFPERLPIEVRLQLAERSLPSRRDDRK